MPSRPKIVVVSLAVAASWACRPVGPPADAREYHPPAVYQRWWQSTEQCAGRTGNLNDLRWFSTPGSAMLHKGQTVSGYWSMQGNFIVLAEDHIRHGQVVRHEMLHALLNSPGHPREAFLGDCAAVVDCSESCWAEATPWTIPRSDYISVPPESLIITTEVRLHDPESDGDRFLSLHVSAQNAGSSAVFVVVAEFPQMPPAFGFDVRGPSGGLSRSDRSADSSIFFFGPGSSKEKVFEFLVAPTLTHVSLPEGETSVRGGYGSRWTPFQSVNIVR